MKKLLYILSILIVVKLSAQDNMTSLSFENISSLTTRVGAPGLSVWVKGFYAANDGGGGFFHWDAASVLTPVPGMILKNPATLTGRWLRDYYGSVDVRWFGTKGDGTTDDASAIQAATNYGGNVNFPNSGTFFINNPISINYSTTFINGNGSTILLGQSTNFSSGAFHTGNTTAVYQDNSPTISMVGGLSYFVYSNHASLSNGQMLLISGPQYDFTSSGGGYSYGTIALIKKISNDTVFISGPIDTSYSAIKLQAYNALNNIKITGLNIYSNANSSAQNIVMSLSTNTYIGGVQIHGHGSFLGISLGQCINGTIENCIVDSVDGSAQGFAYGIQVNGRDLYVKNSYVRNAYIHGISASDRRFFSTNINYIGVTAIADNLSIGSAPMDMHSNVLSGNISQCTIISYKSLGLAMRSSGINIVNNNIQMVNLTNAATVKAIPCFENYRGGNEFYNNKIYFTGGPLTGRIAISFEAGTNIANNIYHHNNFYYNCGYIQNTSEIVTNSRFENDQLLADTMGFNAGYSFVQLYNSTIKNSTIEDKTTTGFSYGTTVSDTGVSNVEISGVRYFSRGKVTNVIRLSSSTIGSFIHNNKFYTTTSGNPILDQSVGVQNVQQRNIKIDSFGVVTPINYVTAPNASSFFVGQIIPISSGTVYLYRKTLSGYDSLNLGQSGPFNHVGNYIYPFNYNTDSLSIGTNVPLAPFTIQGESKFSSINTNPVGTLSNGIGLTLRQSAASGGTNFVMNGYQLGYSINAGDSANTLRGLYMTWSSPNGILSNLYGIFLNGFTSSNVTNYTGMIIGDVVANGQIVSYQSSMSKGANKYTFIGGTAASNFAGSIQIGPGSASDSLNMLRVKGQSRMDSTLSVGGVAIPSALLSATSTAQGFLPPRMTTTQKLAIATPAEGLQVYDLTLHQMSYYNGSTWVNF